MNERIKELLKKAQKITAENYAPGGRDYEREIYSKFAELIIRESALTLYRHAIKDYDAGFDHEAKVMQLAGDIVKQHFGVEE